MSHLRRTGRLPWPTRDELDDDARCLYDHIVQGPRGSGPGSNAVTDEDGRLLGPFNAMLASPAVGEPLQQLGAAIRYATSLPDRVRELAILTVAAYRRSAFEWHAHTEPARAAGLDDATRAAVRAGDGDALSGDDRLVWRAVSNLLAERDLDEGTFAELDDLVGVAGLVELVTLVGYYDLLAMSMRTFRVASPDGADGWSDESR